jgi:hypothetical protein
MSERDRQATTTHGRVTRIFAGDGPCTLCDCTGYTSDGTISGRCTCGDRHGDHRDVATGDAPSDREELVMA